MHCMLLMVPMVESATCPANKEKDARRRRTERDVNKRKYHKIQ